MHKHILFASIHFFGCLQTYDAVKQYRSFRLYGLAHNNLPYNPRYLLSCIQPKLQLSSRRSVLGLSQELRRHNYSIKFVFRDLISSNRYFLNPLQYFSFLGKSLGVYFSQRTHQIDRTYCNDPELYLDFGYCDGRLKGESWSYY